MKNFNIGIMQYSTVLYLHSDRQTYQLDPDYQRESDIWPLDKRQLLIDSIINGFDIPKIYFHKFPKPQKIKGRSYTHAIIDGKQRLSSIWSFIDGNFSLSEATEYLEDKNCKIAGLTYAELGKAYPQIKTRFDSYPLTIVVIETEDIDLIEDMFSRLNEAVPLSAAEKRNAAPGPLPGVIRRVAKGKFFTHNLPFGNKRYRHYDLVAKFLLIEYEEGISDTKKVYLDSFVSDWADRKASHANAIKVKSELVTEKMSKRFVQSDPLLRSVGMIVLYYHLFRIAINGGWDSEISRSKLLEFERKRVKNRKLAEDNIGSAQYDLLEFDRYAQTPNDSYAMSLRLGIILDHVFNREMVDEDLA